MKINVVGMGIKKGDVTLNGFNVVKNSQHIYLRSERLKGFSSFSEENLSVVALDFIYEKTEDFDELNQNIGNFLMEEAVKYGEITYLVDGAGTFEKCLEFVTGVDVEFYPTATKGAEIFAHNGNTVGFTEMSAYDFLEIKNICGDLATNLYIFDLDTAETASSVKLKLGKLIGDEDEVVFFDGENQIKIPLYELDWQKNFNENSGVLVSFKNFVEKTVFTFKDILDIFDVLTSENGCPWDRAQTHQSMRMNLLEEAYETAEAIDLNDPIKLCEELGDLIMQSVHHTLISDNMGDFDMTDVMTGVARKLIDRHTHIFGIDSAENSDVALDVWEKNKEKIKGHTSALDAVLDVPKPLPALMYAEKICKKAAKTGFDFSDISQLFDKLKEETEELQKAISENSNIEEELGDLLFVLANMTRLLKVNGELALTKTSQKFIKRFSEMMAIVDKNGIDMKTLSEKQWDEIYLKAKRNLEQ